MSSLILLAAPYKAEDSHWPQDDFTFPNDFGKRLSQSLTIAIYHSEEDTVIPSGDARLYKQKLPHAKCMMLRGYGHQFEGDLNSLDLG